MLEIDEDDMHYYSDDGIVSCRGRQTRMDSYSGSEFTNADLDAIAPLAPGDAKEMGDYCTPSPETIERVNSRIKAAHILKYGVTE